MDLSKGSIPAAPEGIDGRRLRSLKTQQRIIEAYLALAGEKSPQVPTAAEIAQRAGYSVRSVFERFPDIHSLQVAAVDYALTLVTPSRPPPVTDRLSRIRTQVEARGRACQRWLPLWRSLIVNQGESVELRQRVVALREGDVRCLAAMYAPELSVVSERERRDLLIVLESLTDIESWARMEEFFGLSFEECCSTWIDAIDRLLPRTPARA
jgi:AcrR family transcriptional regulator